MTTPASGQSYKHKSSGALLTVVGVVSGTVMLDNRDGSGSCLVSEEVLAEVFELQTPQEVHEVVEGLRCQACRSVIDGYESGYMRCCDNCENE
jgi:hypothetical protein